MKIIKQYNNMKTIILYVITGSFPLLIKAQDTLYTSNITSTSNLISTAAPSIDTVSYGMRAPEVQAKLKDGYTMPTGWTIKKR